MGRTTKVKKDTTNPQGSLWLKTGGGTLYLKDGRAIKKGDRFYEEKADIPAAFLNNLTLLSTANDNTEGTDEEFSVNKVSGKGHNVFDSENKKMSEKNLTKEEASKLAEELNASFEDEQEEEE